MKKTLIATTLLAGMITAPAVLGFKEFPVGEPVTMNEMEIAAVYLQPVDMEPRGMGLPAAKSDIHLEADIHATKGNKNGFGEGEWMPYLTIQYTLVNSDTGEKQEGTFMPMVASDGPHYGANIKMMGVGNYKLTYHIDSLQRILTRHQKQVCTVTPMKKPVLVAGGNRLMLTMNSNSPV